MPIRLVAGESGLSEALTPVNTPEADHQVVFLLNFFDELRRRVPVGVR